MANDQDRKAEKTAPRVAAVQLANPLMLPIVRITVLLLTGFL
jgi:hypothetical protein